MNPTDQEEKRAWLVRNAVAAIGLGLLAAGTWWVYPPAALIVVGAVLLSATIYGAIRK